MPFLRAFPEDLTFPPHQTRRPRASLFNSFRHARPHRRHSAPTSQVSTHPYANPATHLKPIYIYPGLLRIVREKAIALDNQCPAVHYQCCKCHERSSLSPQTHQCEHTVCCPICLEKFHGKDLVRKLPCDANHMFHSKCILDWFAFQQRCPLCNEYVSNSIQRCAPSRADSPALPLDLRRRFVEDRRDIGHRLLRFFGVDVNLVRFPREIADAPADRLPSTDVGDIFCPSASTPEQDRFQSSPRIPHEPHQEHRRDSSETSGASGTNSTSSDANRWQQRSKGPRTYSYIVHDNVRMEMNARIPV